MNNGELKNHTAALAAPRTRWLAIVTGCISGLAGSLPFGPLFVVISAILVFGAVLQRWSPRSGRLLMWLGACVLTLDVGAFFGPLVLRPPHLIDTNIVVVLTLCLVSLVLVGWCDVALIIDSHRSRNAPIPAKPRFPGAADWIVGIFALCLSVLAGWSILKSFYLFHHYGRLDISLFAVVFGVVVAAFDAAIVADAVKTYRSGRSQGTGNE